MNSFPVITNDLVTICFLRLRELYSSDLNKILQAAQTSTSGEPSPFTVVPGASINSQVDIIDARVKRTADGYGQKLLVKIIEHLYEDLQVNGAIGVTDTAFFDATKIILHDESEVQYKAGKKWHWLWRLEVESNPGLVYLDIRKGITSPGEIVPGYILQYIQQGIAAFKSGKHAVAMALMTIALEGTLRDALYKKGYTYQYGAPTEDLFEIKDMYVHKDISGYKVTFPDPMPEVHANYLSAAEDPTHKVFSIKRVKKRDGKFILQISGATDLLDYWSSDYVTTAGTMQVSGLGAAINIGRNHLNIITPIDIPEDLDKPIQSVRNNLIHLSGTSMSEVVQQDINGLDITLADFLNNKNRVFDAVCTIGNSINTIFNKIADGTL